MKRLTKPVLSKYNIIIQVNIVKEVINMLIPIYKDFELFKSEACHCVRRYGDKKFIEELLNDDQITYCFNKKMYAETFYLLAMLDYLKKVNNIAITDKYDYLRKQQLNVLLFPRDIVLMDKLMPNKNIKQKYINECKSNPCSREFLKYNIIEGDIRDVK